MEFETRDITPHLSILLVFLKVIHRLNPLVHSFGHNFTPSAQAQTPIIRKDHHKLNVLIDLIINHFVLSISALARRLNPIVELAQH